MPPVGQDARDDEPSPCPDEAAWQQVRETAGEALDAAFLDHLRACPPCAGRFAALAAEWSHADIAASGDDADDDAREIAARIAAAPPPPGPPPPVIEGLEDLVQIGRGGMGIVYRARDTRLGRTVAVKVLPAGAALSLEGRRRAQREARLLARIRHPNIVPVHAVVEAAGAPAIVMEWIDGPSLADHARARRMPLPEALRLVRALAGAVAAVHAAGIVHRDIKPGNVLLAPAEGGGTVPKLVDFGLARPDDDAGQSVTRSSATVGTPAFMAPEQTGLDPALGPVGPAADIHGLGALLYWLLSGRAPFEAATGAVSLRLAAVADAPPISALVPRLPSDVSTIVSACLERRPDRRYRSATALADDLGRVLDGRPILARRTRALERLRRWAWRRPVAAALSGSALLAAVGIFGAGAFHLRSLERGPRPLERQRLEAIAAARLARESFARLTDSSAERFLARGRPLDAADRAHLVALRDRYRDWPLEPDAPAALHFRADGLFRLTTLFFEHAWLEEALDTARLSIQALADVDRRGLSTPEEIRRAGNLPRLEREVLGRLGRMDEAIAATRAAIAALGPRAEADAALGADLAVAWGDLGNLLGRAGRLAEARAAYEEALQGFARLSRQAPDDARSAGLALTVLYNAAINPAYAADRAARRGLLVALLERAEDGMERFPEQSAGFERGLLLGMAVLAHTDLEDGRAPEALALAERRVALARRLAARGPESAGALDELIPAAEQIFRCHRALGSPGDARAALDEAIALAGERVASEPARIHRTWSLAEILLAKATMEEDLGRFEEALALFARMTDAMRPWVKADAPSPFPITLADVQARIERAQAALAAGPAPPAAPTDGAKEPYEP